MTHRLEHDGIRFAFAATGEGRPVVLLHGLGGDRGGGLALLGELDGWRGLALDQRGHGETEPVGPDDGYTFDVLAADVCALLDWLGVSTCVVAGVSMGAGVALRLALRSPERVSGLVLVRPAWVEQPLTENLRPYVEIAALLRTKPLTEARAALESSPAMTRMAAVSSHAAETLRGQLSAPRAAERAVRLDRMPRSVPYEDALQLRDVVAPTLVIGCEMDPLHPIEFAREWVRGIPRSSLEVVSTSARDTDRHRDEVRLATQRFLRELESGSRGRP